MCYFKLDAILKCEIKSIYLTEINNNEINKNQQNQRPVASVAHQAQVRQGLFWRAQVSFSFGELIAEFNEKPAVTFTLLWRMSEDARNIVVLGIILFLQET